MTSKPSFIQYLSQLPNLQLHLSPLKPTYQLAQPPDSFFKMVKDNETVIQELNELVNISASHLETWLKTEDSTSSGWIKNDGSETIGQESGRKVIEIRKKNPKKDPEGYDEDDIQHMRRMVAYSKRHLAQEETAKKDMSSKSYRSLKNWGHDAQKA